MSEPINEFLPCKYEAVPFIGAVNADPSLAKDVGWKLRKSIRWKDVHVGDAPPELLKQLGDSLVDDSSCEAVAFSRVHSVLLRRSQYNSRNKDFDRPPKVRADWKSAQKKIELASAHPEYLANELLHSCHSELLEELTEESLEQWLQRHGRVVFYGEVIAALVSVVRSSTDPTEIFPHQSAFEDHEGELPEPDFADLTKLFQDLYTDYDLEPPACEAAIDLLTTLACDLGLPAPSCDGTPIPLPENYDQKPNEYRFQYTDLEGLDLIRVSSEGGYALVTINTRHPLTRLSHENPDTEQAIEVLVSGLLTSAAKLNIDSDTMENLLKYTGLHIRSTLADEQ